MEAQQYIMPLVVAFGVAAATTPLVRRLALGTGVIDRPSERSVNRRPDMPLMGGMAIGLGFAAGLAVALRQMSGEVAEGRLMGLAVGGAIVLASGIWDDRFGMRAPTKFTLQVLAAVVAVSNGYELAHFTEPFTRQSYALPGWLMWTVTILWIVMITNAINLVDGLDGLATGVAAIIAATLAIIAGQTGTDTFGLWIALALVGSLLGFLPFNFAPARIFLGDTGALFIGFVLSLIALEGYRQVSLLTFVVPILALAVPILDTGLSVIRRIKNRSPIFAADRQHMHHRMLESEGTARSAVLQFYLLTAAFGLLSIGVSRLEEAWWVGICLVMVIALTFRLVSNLGALQSDSETASAEDSSVSQTVAQTKGAKESKP
jgi:UDP-GlcNAc:undecaprenyl-phosphate GlcNAc-1-phosphate transferase